MGVIEFWSEKHGFTRITLIGAKGGEGLKKGAQDVNRKAVETAGVRWGRGVDS